MESNSNLFLFSKTVDWSILNDGVSIPIRTHPIIMGAIGNELRHGERQHINFRLDGHIYKVLLTNTNYDRIKYPDRSDIIQFRWSKTGSLAKHLRRIFQASYNELEHYRATIDKSGMDRPIIHESITFLYNYNEQLVELEYISADDFLTAKEHISKVKEDDFEYQQNYYQADSTSSLVYKDAVVKIRRINRSIITDLKILYDYHCQICGTCFTEYDVRFMEAHHIDPFVKSMNNDSDNIMIVCPNHHRIIHSVNPEFYDTGLYFLYPNGLKEVLKINRHIGIENTLSIKS